MKPANRMDMGWNPFKKKEQIGETVTAEQQVAQVQWQREHAPEEKKHELDFDATIAKIVVLTPKAQATFLFKLVTALDPRMAATANKYTYRKLYPHGNSRRDKGDQLGQKQYNPVTDEFESAA
jgi:hypothetical protein